MFVGKTLVARHRLIYSALSEELAAGLHALQLATAKARVHGFGMVGTNHTSSGTGAIG